MFQNFFLTSFVRGLAKTSNKKSFFINNSILYNKNINNKNLQPENKIINNITYKRKKRIEFHESHSRRGHIIEKINK